MKNQPSVKKNSVNILCHRKMGRYRDFQPSSNLDFSCHFLTFTAHCFACNDVCHALTDIYYV